MSSPYLHERIASDIHAMLTISKGVWKKQVPETKVQSPLGEITFALTWNSVILKLEESDDDGELRVVKAAEYLLNRWLALRQ